MYTTAGIISLGCSKNRVDSEHMLGMLAAQGIRIVRDPAEAELIIVNTCGFIGPAKEEAIDALLEMSEFKRTGKLRTLVAAGCLAQRYGEALYADMPELDAILGVNDTADLIEILKQAQQGRPLATGGACGLYEGPRVLTTPPYTAYLKISDGCDNRCTYCAIPLIRGPYRSRPVESIAREARELAARGVRELTLVAQDTSRYGDDLSGYTRLLPKLLSELSGIDGLVWLRALYTYPESVDEALIEALARTPKVCPYLDIPLQHISAPMLAAMNRRGSPEHIRRALSLARQAGLTLRTTFIVGFPGETEAMFEELLAFVEQARFDRMGAFAYSQEEDTAAAAMPGQIEEEVKQRRLARLMALQQRISRSRGKARIGERATVLIEGGQDGRLYGRTRREAPEIDGKVWFTPAREHAPGEFVEVVIEDADEYDLRGVEA